MMEIFVFLITGGSADRVCILPLAGDASNRSICPEDIPASASFSRKEAKRLCDSLLTFTCGKARCSSSEDRQKLLGIIESGYGSSSAFDKVVRGLVRSCLYQQERGNVLISDTISSDWDVDADGEEALGSHAQVNAELQERSSASALRDLATRTTSKRSRKISNRFDFQRASRDSVDGEDESETGIVCLDQLVRRISLVLSCGSPNPNDLDFGIDVKKCFGTLDNAELAGSLKHGHIRLVCPKWLCENSRILCRQELEDLQKNGEKPFLSCKEAVAALQQGERNVGALTYAWGACGDPDPSNEIFAAVRKYLFSPKGQHIKAVFWDFASLYQNRPRRHTSDEPLYRTSEQAVEFKEALKVMGALYASVIGVTVMRHAYLPPPPQSFEGAVRIFDAPPGSEEDVCEALRATGCEAPRPFEAQHGQYIIKYGTQLEAEKLLQVVKQAGKFDWPLMNGMKAVPAYNSMPYFQRGWPTFESAVATQSESLAKEYKGVREQLANLPRKLVDIGTATDTSGGRSASVCCWSRKADAVKRRLEKAVFTGTGDRAEVIYLYTKYAASIRNAMAQSVNAAKTEGVARNLKQALQLDSGRRSDTVRKSEVHIRRQKSVPYPEPTAGKTEIPTRSRKLSMTM